MRTRFSLVLAAVASLSAVAVGCGNEVSPDREAVRDPSVQSAGESQKASPSGPLYTSIGTLDVEAEYLPRVVAQEIAGVTSEPEALKAQAVAARTFLARALVDNPALGKSKPVDCSQGFQDCSGSANAAVRAAVLATKGQILTHEGLVITANFDSGATLAADGTPKAPSAFGYPGASWAGARASVKAILDKGGSLYGKNGAVVSVVGQDGDPTAWTELYVTYNEGKSGSAVTPTLQSYGAKANRGALSQWGAIRLAAKGRDYRSILRYFYGADIEIAGQRGTEPPLPGGAKPPAGDPSPAGDPGANEPAPAAAAVSCTSDLDCHHGAAHLGVVCAASGPSAQTCIDACHTDSDCEEQEMCDKTTQPHWSCTASFPALGTACSDDLDCGGPQAGRVCANSGAPAGTCIVGCHGDVSCPQGSTCHTDQTPWICVGAEALPPATTSHAPKNVPFECQYSNGIDEDGAKGGNTCATTSTSMALRYFGVPLNAKQYFDAYRSLGYSYEDAKSFTTIPSILEAIPQTKGKFKTKSLVSGQGGTTADLKQALDEGYLVVVGANLFGGHVVLVTGYDDKGVYVNDPAGVWHPSLGNTGDAYDRCYGDTYMAKGELISWETYKARNVFCGEDVAVHLCPAKADLWMMAIKTK